MLTLTDLLHKTTIDPREAELLLAFVLKKDRPYVIAHAKDKVGSKVAKTFLSLVQRRKKHEPIAYLTGEQPFFGRDFLVNRHTLIPRPETEMLIGLVKQSAKGRSVIVDVGTGSGCIAVTLALECPNARVVASDVSSAALKVAKQNAKQLGADVEFVKDNLLGKKLKSELNSKLDVVFVANLPYLPSSDKKTMMPDVAKYEPSKALFAGRDGSTLVIKLLQQIRMLNVQCSMFFEVDPRQTEKLAALAHQLFPNHKVSIKQDLCGRERFLIIT